MTGLVFDGANRWIGDHAQGLVDLRRVEHARNRQLPDHRQRQERHFTRTRRRAHRPLDDIGRCRSRHLFGRGDRPQHHRQQRLGLRQWRHPRASLADGRRRHDRDRKPRRAHRRAQRRDRPIRQRHQHFSRQQGDRFRKCRLGLRFLGDPRQQFEQSPDRRQHLFDDPAKPRSTPNSLSRARSISGNIVDGAANGISIVNFNEGGRACGLLRQSRPQPVERRPLPRRCARLRRRHQRRGRYGRHREHDRERAALRHQDRLGAVSCATWLPPETSSATPEPASQ